MGHLTKIDSKVIESIKSDLKRRDYNLSNEAIAAIVDLIEEEVVYYYVDRLINQIENIMEIDPTLPDKEILQIVARSMVIYLDAEAASIRIYDPIRDEMVAFGTYPGLFGGQEEAIPFENSIAGEVVRTRRSYFVPNILKEEKYKNKEKVFHLGIHSMLACPFSIPRFSLKDVNTAGSIQIYFKEKDKEFTPLEGKIAETFSRRVSYVIARKRIMDLQKLHMTKDRIMEQIFLKIGRREGVKMREVFNLTIPTLADIMQIERCSFFSVSDDRQSVFLEAGYPEREHGIGKVFSAKEPYIDAIVNQTGPFGVFENEKIYPTYILIDHPGKSRLLTPELKHFLEAQQIHSVLYIPLRVNETVNYFLAFDAQAYHHRFTDEEIEIFTFYGMELVKGLRMEKMDDILHDFKNPAIAAAGFAKRVQKILEEGEYSLKKEKVHQALDVILKETSRIQELALTLHGEGREEVVDLTEKLGRRFHINEEAMRELRRERIQLIEGDLQSSLWVRCFPLHLERVLDNLLNNATNAVPQEGGTLSVQSYRRDSWAVAEITNSGEIREADKDRYLLGDGKGRGISITTRLVKRMGGKVEVESGGGKTTFRVMLPLVEKENA
jgi:signal transduction histidine kinase